MSKKEPQYHDISKKLIKMALGDKVKIEGDKGEEEECIEIKGTPEGGDVKKAKIPPSPQQIAFNLISSIAVILGGIIGCVMPLIVCVVYTIQETKGAADDIDTLKGLFNLLFMISRFYLDNFIFTMVIGVITAVIVGISLILKAGVDVLEYYVLKNIFKKYYNKIANKLESLDKDEEDQKRRMK
jgi:hypothetical protein